MAERLKPLPPAPLTFEDWAIYMDHRNDPRRAYLLGARFGINRDADRRDAALMFAWAQGWPIDLGGDDEDGECLFWKTCVGRRTDGGL